MQKQFPGDFWACFTLGTVVFDKLPADAIRYYQAALASHPESALGHTALGRGLSTAGRYEDAVGHFREAIRLEPTFGEAMGDLGWDLAQLGPSDEALKFVQDAVALDGSAKNHHALAGILEQQGKHDEALAEFQRCTEIDPKFFWAYLHRAEVMEEMGHADEAMAEFERCRDVNPESGWVHVVIAEHLNKQGRIEDAMKELTIATVIDAPLLRASAHHALGDCWRAKGAPDRALVEYNLALLLNPTDTSLLRGRREVMVQLGLGRAALAEWTRVVDANPEPHEYGNGYAELCIYAGDRDAYERACHRLLDRYESSPEPRVWERVGRACLLGVIPASDASRASALIEKAVRADLAPTEAWAKPYFLVAQGLARYRAGDFEGAVESIGDDSRTLDGPRAYLVLAMAHQGAGHRADALRSFAQAIARLDWDPSHIRGEEDWIDHVLRREAERAVMPNLDALLAGRESPRDEDERLALEAVRESTRHAPGSLR